MTLVWANPLVNRRRTWTQSSRIFFSFGNPCVGGQGGGAREKRGREGYGRRESKGQEAGVLRGREAGEKYKTLTFFNRLE